MTLSSMKSNPLTSPSSESDSSRVSKFPGLGFSLTSDSFSSRRSDGQNQRFPQALDLSRVNLVPSYTPSLYPKVSVPLHTYGPWSAPYLRHMPRAGKGPRMTFGQR